MCNVKYNTNLSSTLSTIQTTLRAFAGQVLIVKMLRNVECRQDVIVVEFFLFPACLQLYNLEIVLNLTTIHVHMSELLQL